MLSNNAKADSRNSSLSVFPFASNATSAYVTSSRNLYGMLVKAVWSFYKSLRDSKNEMTIFLTSLYTESLSLLPSIVWQFGSSLPTLR